MRIALVTLQERFPDGHARVELTVTPSRGTDIERFSDPDEFVAQVTPEALAAFHRLSIVAATSNGIEIEVVLLRTSAREKYLGRDDRVELVFTAPRAIPPDDIRDLGIPVVEVLRRGFRGWWGSAKGSAWVERPAGWHRAISAPAGALWVAIAPFAVGALVAIGLVSTIEVLLPALEIPGIAWLVVLAVIGGSYRIAFALAVPNVEISTNSRGRLEGVLRWTALALASFALAHVLDSALGP